MGSNEFVYVPFDKVVTTQDLKKKIDLKSIAKMTKNVETTIEESDL